MPGMRRKYKTIHRRKKIGADYIEEITDKGIKKHLDVVLLALLMKEPLCGEDVVKLIYEKFQVLLGPSTVYPTLHELKRDGFVLDNRVGKRKVYSIAPYKKREAKALVGQAVDINRKVIRLLSGEI